MSFYFDKQFIDTKLAVMLPLFSWTRDGLAQFRCPLCGDSKKSQTKRRAFFYEDKTEDCARFKCHNCGECSGWGLGAWLSEFNTGLQQAYNFEKFRKGKEPKKKAGFELPKSPQLQKASLFDDIAQGMPQTLLERATRVSDLSVGHIARKYVSGRQIPPHAYERLLFTDNFKQFLAGLGVSPEVVEKAPEDERLVIPFLNMEGDNWEVVQGRALSKYSAIRYYTAKREDSCKKIFGLEKLRLEKPRLVVEGPIDSLFLPNCVATADSNLLSFEHGSVYIPDNQYRNPEICSGIEKIINSGKAICLFPREYEKYKDINEFIEGGVSINELLMIIASNTYKGLKAKMQWAKLKGV